MKGLQDVPRGSMLSNALRALTCANKENPNWTAVMDICGVGSRSAFAICKSVGLDPNQKIYDYPALHDSEFCGKERGDMFERGNVLRSLAGLSSRLYVMVIELDDQADNAFSGIVLVDVSEYYDVGDRVVKLKEFQPRSGFTGPMWELSSLEEAVNAQ